MAEAASESLPSCDALVQLAAKHGQHEKLRRTLDNGYGTILDMRLVHWFPDEEYPGFAQDALSVACRIGKSMISGHRIDNLLST